MLAGKLEKIETKAAKLTGSFDVFLDEDLVYSKKMTGRLPHPGEVEQLITTRIG